MFGFPLGVNVRLVKFYMQINIGSFKIIYDFRMLDFLNPASRVRRTRIILIWALRQ